MEMNEAIEMMQRCRVEIQSLQKRIEYLQPRAEAYEVVRDVVRMQHQSAGMPMGQDVVHLLNNAIARELDRAKQAEPPDRSKEYRGAVVSAQEGEQTIGSSLGPDRYTSAELKAKVEARRELDRAKQAEMERHGRSVGEVMADLESQQAKRNVGKRPGYDGVKD